MNTAVRLVCLLSVAGCSTAPTVRLEPEMPPPGPLASDEQAAQVACRADRWATALGGPVEASWTSARQAVAGFPSPSNDTIADIERYLFHSVRHLVEVQEELTKMHTAVEAGLEEVFAQVCAKPDGQPTRRDAATWARGYVRGLWLTLRDVERELGPLVEWCQNTYQPELARALHRSQTPALEARQSVMAALVARLQSVQRALPLKARVLEELYVEIENETALPWALHEIPPELQSACSRVQQVLGDIDTLVRGTANVLEQIR